MDGECTGEKLRLDETEMEEWYGSGEVHAVYQWQGTR